MTLALNVFKTVTQVATGTTVGIYTAPVGYTGVVLLAQAANTDTNTHTICFNHQRSSTNTEIVKNLPISGNDTVSLLNGKLVLQSGDILTLSANDNVSVKFIGSILETLN
jgi:hypothetical protein